MNFKTSCCNLKMRCLGAKLCGFSIIFILKRIMTESMHFVEQNNNTLTGPSNCKKTRHQANLSLCAKPRKTNDVESGKWSKTSIMATFWQFRGHISPNPIFFLKNRFHTNWSSYLILMSGQKPKKTFEPF